MWAFYFENNDSMITMSRKNRKTGDHIKSYPLITDDVTEVGRLKEEVLKVDPECKFYVARGTFIPEEKL